MAEYTVASLIATLQNTYQLDEIVVASLWSKDDVAQVIADESYGRDGMTDEEFVAQVWHHVSGEVEIATEYHEEEMNRQVKFFVEDYVMRGEK
jgi:hypothetical protein